MALWSRYSMVDLGEETRRVRFEPVAEGLAIAFRRWIQEKLADDGQVVVERADGSESRDLGVAVMAPGCGEHEGGGDDVKRDALLLESGCQLAIGGARAIGCVGDAAIEIEHAPDVGGDHGSGACGSGARVLAGDGWSLELGPGL